MDSSQSVELSTTFKNLPQRAGPMSMFVELNIPFKRKKRQTFWQANEAELEYLYKDLCSAVKERLVELHPDKNRYGNDAFIDFRERSEALKRSFHKKGIGGVCALVKAQRAEDRKPVRKRRGGRKKVVVTVSEKAPRRIFHKTTPCDKIMQFLNEGKKIKFIVKELHTTWNTVTKVKKLLRN